MTLFKKVANSLDVVTSTVRHSGSSCTVLVLNRTQATPVKHWFSCPSSEFE
eukprot:CAMPEP_0184334732 /NCGR_PEP_ID=MMETSP1089-20130417/3411_1 /TAXON_ID=38269 ORGANISM="Gloeochaete wittrockiana, Strain SAG46.84" /NCGR_SAMPLE_ID=MMETSP1089 /ASSEMBLY_ACC=CAM_ASM_000445 /LENGTH=50 /DNA_ID=CAMNT_0026659067 /DNA_START=318 /DNA_END=470 /DNA_ORIENTATION=+